MKRGTPANPKTADLADALGIRIYSACGLLELTWHFAEEFAPAGDIGKHTNPAIARAAQWEKDPTKLVSAMLKTRWLDRHPAHRIVVHDWFDHCVDAVHMKLARAGLRFATGQIPKLGRLNQQEREQAKLAYFSQDGGTSVRTENAHDTHHPTRPDPATPNHNHTQPDQANGDGAGVDESTGSGNGTDGIGPGALQRMKTLQGIDLNNETRNRIIHNDHIDPGEFKKEVYLLKLDEEQKKIESIGAILHSRYGHKRKRSA